MDQSEHRVADLNKASAQLARRAGDGAFRSVIFAGSIGSTGELFSPLGGLDRHSAVAAFKE